MLATTSTVNVAGEAFEQSENSSKAHPSIEITDAHAGLAGGAGAKVRRSRSEERGDGEVKVKGKGKGRMGSRVGGLMKRVVRG